MGRHTLRLRKRIEEMCFGRREQLLYSGRAPRFYQSTWRRTPASWSVVLLMMMPEIDDCDVRSKFGKEQASPAAVLVQVPREVAFDVLLH